MADVVLVTGAAGFVGRSVVPRLRDAGLEVWSYTRAHGDLATAPSMPAGASCVVHLAGRTFVPESWEHPERFYRDNTLATANVLEYCRRHDARLVHVSTYVYGAPTQLPVPESHRIEATTPYNHSKVLAEEMVQFYQQRFSLAATVIRPFNLYGPGQDARFIVPSIVRQVVDPQVHEIAVATLVPRRDYVHVDDLADLVVAAVAGPSGGVYNAGSGASTSVGELIAMACDLAGVSKPVRVNGEVRPGDILDCVADVARAGRELGWHPRVALREGLAGTVASVTRGTVA